jgi:hypothetical protein
MPGIRFGRRTRTQAWKGRGPGGPGRLHELLPQAFQKGHEGQGEEGNVVEGKDQEEARPAVEVKTGEPQGAQELVHHPVSAQEDDEAEGHHQPRKGGWDGVEGEEEALEPEGEPARPVGHEDPADGGKQGGGGGEEEGVAPGLEVGGGGEGLEVAGKGEALRGGEAPLQNGPEGVGEEEEEEKGSRKEKQAFAAHGKRGAGRPRPRRA